MAIPFPEIDPVAFEIGVLAVRWYSLAYLVGIVGGWFYAKKLIANHSSFEISYKNLDDFVTWAVLGVILGGRFFYVMVYNPIYYIENPIDALKIWQGGMSFHGGAIGVITASYLYCRKNSLDFLKLMDICACAAPIGLFFGRIANFVNAELYGRTTDVAWAVIFPNSDGMPRHPSQLYQAFTEGLLLFIIMFILARYTNISARKGALSGVFLVGYWVARTFCELFREPDSQIGFLFGNITMGQFLSLPMLMVGSYLLLRKNRVVG